MKNALGLIAIFLFVLNLGYSGYLHCRLSQTPKIGVIRMDRLVYAYQGMQEASQVYADQMVLWGHQADSLQQLLMACYENFHQDSIKGKSKSLPVYKRQIEVYQSQLVTFQQNIQQSATQKDEHMTQGVLNQIRTHIQSFAEEFNYDLLLVTRESQDLSYVRESNDVTAAIIQYANEKYRHGE